MKTGARFAGNVMDTPLEVKSDARTGKGLDQNLELASLIQHELMKLMKGKMPMTGNMVNFTYLEDFAGSVLKPKLTYALNSAELFRPGTWIVDTGASSHMCTDLSLIHKPTQLIKKHLSISQMELLT